MNIFWIAPVDKDKLLREIDDWNARRFDTLAFNAEFGRFARFDFFKDEAGFVMINDEERGV